MKKMITVLLGALFVLALPGNGALATEGKYVFLTVKSENVDLWDCPTMKGKVLRQANEFDWFIAEKTPIHDSGDNSQWYKLVYEIQELGGVFFPVKPAEYIGAKFSVVKPLEERHQGQLDWIAAGKPPKFKSGDTLLTDESINEAKLVTPETAFTLFLAPRKDAEKKTFPKGTKVYVQDVDGRGDPGAYEMYASQDPGTWYFSKDDNGDDWTGHLLNFHF